MKPGLLLVACCLALSGCGAELNRSSEVEGLRVLGVHKTKSYARAGDEITFSMLWHDAKGRDVTPVWFAVSEGQLGLLASLIQAELLGDDPPPMPSAGDDEQRPPWADSSQLLPICANPPRDSYFGCLAAHAEIFSRIEGAVDLLSQTGDSITLTVPRSTVAPRVAEREIWLPALPDCEQVSPDDYDCRSIYHPPPDASNQPDFGSMFVFFALCPGRLEYDSSLSEGFGLVCLDEDDRPFGTDDFVFGYSQIFLYEELENQNPVIDGMLVNGEEATACVGLDCLDDDADRPEECTDGVVCLDVCNETDQDNCPEIELKPLVPRTYSCEDGECDNAELDELAQIAYGRSYLEQMWIRYHADGGKMGSEVKLLNDAVTGWNPDYGTELKLPQETGPLRLWAVVYDNRGGQNWVRVDAVVK